MPENIGPHLLGRNPSPPDHRDFQLTPFLAAKTPLDVLLAHLNASWTTSKAVKQWAKAVTAMLDSYAPAPTPPPEPTGANEWEMLYHLNQGDTPRCVGFASAGWEGAAPVEDAVTDADGDRIYLACKDIDGYPNEDGTDVRSAAKVLQTAGRLSVYAFAANADEAIQWIRTKGTIVFGTNWYDQMFTPDENGFSRIGGSVAGGHAWLGKGYSPSLDAIKAQNSWGTDWGVKGDFWVTRADLDQLMREQGEALAAVELPL